MSDQNGSAVLQIPLPNGQGNKRSLPCEMEGLQGKRLIVSSPERIQESTLVSVEYEDTLFLGEVVICNGSADQWKLEIRVEQMLNGLQSLMKLREHLLTESANAPVYPVGARN